MTDCDEIDRLINLYSHPVDDAEWDRLDEVRRRRQDVVLAERHWTAQREPSLAKGTA